MTHLEAFLQKLPAGTAALISAPQNQYYLSGFHFEDGYLLIFADEALLLTDPRYEEAAKKDCDPAFEVLCPAKVTNTVGERLAAHGVRTLTVEENHMTLATRARFESALGGVMLTGGTSAILTVLRAQKDEKELAAMGAAQQITDAAFSHILNYIKPGLREIDVALELEFFMRKNGADGLAFNTIAVSGSASSLPHGVPRGCLLEKGFLTMDFGARYGGYCSDMTRTVVLGRADADMKRLYQTVLKAQCAALNAAGAGVSCRELDGIARGIIDDAGYRGRFGHSLGHGVGIDVHEQPRLSYAAAEGDVLLPGHVVTFEPGIYLPGRYGCRIEDMAAVRADGSLLDFTASPKEMIELPWNC